MREEQSPLKYLLQSSVNALALNPGNLSMTQPPAEPIFYPKGFEIVVIQLIHRQPLKTVIDASGKLYRLSDLVRIILTQLPIKIVDRKQRIGSRTGLSGTDRHMGKAALAVQVLQYRRTPYHAPVFLFFITEEANVSDCLAPHQLLHLIDDEAERMADTNSLSNIPLFPF